MKIILNNVVHCLKENWKKSQYSDESEGTENLTGI
jgi:hypothetical protein